MNERRDMTDLSDSLSIIDDPNYFPELDVEQAEEPVPLDSGNGVASDGGKKVGTDTST